jgi:hypothetical protein
MNDFSKKSKTELHELALGPENQAETKLAILELQYRQIVAATSAATWTKFSTFAITASVVVMAAGVIVDFFKR